MTTKDQVRERIEKAISDGDAPLDFERVAAERVLASLTAPDSPIAVVPKEMTNKMIIAAKEAHHQTDATVLWWAAALSASPFAQPSGMEEGK